MPKTEKSVTPGKEPENFLNRYVFTPYSPRSGPRFVLRTWDANKRDSHGKHKVRYELVMRTDLQPPVTLFEGDDYACSPMHAIDSVATAEGIMGFLTLRPGDTDAEYFANYTPAQREFCEQWAEALSCEVDGRWKDENGNLKQRYR